MIINKNNKKLILASLGILYITASIGIGVYLTQMGQRTRINAAGVNLSVTSNVTNVQVNSSFVANIVMNTQGFSATGADLTVNYDPNRLTATAIQAGPFMPNVFIGGTIDTNGRANIVLGCPLDAAGPRPVNGTGIVAQITFTMKAAGATTISVNPLTKVAVIGQTTNQLNITTPLQITGVSTSVRTPTPIPSRTPTLTPRPIPTKKPNVIPTKMPNFGTGL